MKQVLLLFAILLTEIAIGQKEFVANYDETKVGHFSLPDALLAGKKRIQNKTEWEQNRRYWLDQFSKYMYGKLPVKAVTQTNTLISEKEILGGRAIQSIWRMNFSGLHQATVVVILPKSERPVPVFLGLNFCGNQTISDDEGIPVFDKYVICNDGPGFIKNLSQPASRGTAASKWQIEKVIAAGFGTITAACGDFEEDNPDGYKKGVRTSLMNELGISPGEWSANGAWAWGLSRMLDLAKSISQVDGNRVIVHGFSRLGKAALWAGANDTRFAAAISNESGEGGAALTRRNYGENLWRITNHYPYWFLSSYASYASRENELPFDQHILLSLVAPRPLYVASAFGDQWSDPHGEFLSLQLAGKVYKLYGKKGLDTDTMPALNTPIGTSIRYHIRDGKHDITAYDWDQYIDFGKKELKNN